MIKPTDANIERVAEEMVDNQDFYPIDCAIADAWGNLTLPEQRDIYVRLLKKIYRDKGFTADINEDWQELGLGVR